MSLLPAAAGSRWLIPRSLLLASSIAMVGVLFLLFPHKQRTIDVVAHQNVGALTLAYLRVLLRANPDNQVIRRALARNLTAIGNWSEARSALAPLAAQPGPDGFDARLALLEIDQATFRQKTSSDPQRGRIGAAMGAQIQAMLMQPAPSAALKSLAQASRELNRPDLAARAYTRLADTDPASQQRWLALAAREFLADSSPLKAALAYATLATRAGNPLAVRRHYTLLALDTFAAANDGAAALTFAESIADTFSADTAVLERMIAVAQSQNAVLVAQRFGRRLLALSPDSLPALEKQLDIELAAGAPQAALSLVTRLVTLAPTVQYRTRLAQIADWNSAQLLALTHWTILARLAPTGPAMPRALALARARTQDDLWLELIGKATATRLLSADEQTFLLAIAERTPGSPPLQRFLSGYLARSPAPLQLWVTLSQAHAAGGDIKAAAATLRRIPAKLAGQVESARLEAQLLMRAARPGDALEQLRAVRPLATNAETGYWVLLGDLAWQRDLRVEALQAYRVAWDGGTRAAQVAERLMEGNIGRGEVERAILLGREAYQRFDNPRWLLLAMDAAARANRWADLRAMLQAARSKAGQFEPLAMYWMLAAHLANHDGHKGVARAAYERALLLNPRAVPVRVALLWFEIDNNELVPLALLLQKWRNDAAADSAYWKAFAAGMLRLQRVEESLPWFQRQLQLTPDDPEWSLDYASALARAGRAAQALQVRRKVHQTLRAWFSSGDRRRVPLPKHLMLAYASLVREFDGAAAAQAVLIGMIRRGDDAGPTRELLVAALLAQKNFEDARYWLQRARAARYTLPAWQYLAVAQARNDRQEIVAILASPASKLSDLDRIGALRKLGQNAQALALAEVASRRPQNTGNQALADTTRQLRVQQSKRAGTVAEQRRLDNLDMRALELYGSVPVSAGRVTMRLANTRLDGTTPAIQGSVQENDLSALAELPFGLGQARITLGGNKQNGDSVVYARAAWSRPLLPRVGLLISGAVKTLSEDSALMRAIGKKDKLSGALTFDLDNSRYARLELASQHYATRHGAWLASGYRVEGELGATAFKRDPVLVQLRLSASWERNQLAKRLPHNPGSFRIPPSAGVSDVVAARYGWLGLGGTAIFGDQDSVPGRLHGQIDAVLGQQWPERTSAYSMHAVVSLPLAPRDALRVEAFRSNVKSGVATAASQGARFSYEHQF